MSTPTRRPRQQVPAAFAARLVALAETKSPLLNPVLVACRARGWSSPALAYALHISSASVSKRVERARAGHDGASDDLVAAAVGAIPDPVRVDPVDEQDRLSPAQVRRLQDMQHRAARVNGALPADHPDRRVSEQLSAELHRLITAEQLSPSYLARVLGLSGPRAITSRLERHAYRRPCPSVANTSSGEYRNRKIGDPPDPLDALGLSVRIRNALRRGRIRTLDELLAHTDSDLLAIAYFGPTQLAELKQRLAAQGLSLAVRPIPAPAVV